MITFGMLKIKNFFRVKSLQINLNSPGLNLIEGENQDLGSSNEAGKSTIFEALCWCLYGRYAAGSARSSNEVVNPSSKKDCEVSVEVVSDSETYIVTRQRLMNGSKSGKLWIKANDAEIEIGQGSVDQLIGMEYETFVRVAYFPQEGIIPFGRMSDKALKDFFLEKVLDINWVNDAREKAKEELKEKEGNYTDAQVKVDVAELKLVKCKELLEDYAKNDEAWLHEKIKRTIDSKYEIKALVQNLLKEKREIKRYREKGKIIIEDISQKRAALIAIQSVLKSFTAEQKQVMTNFHRADNEIQYIEKKVLDLKKKIVNISNDDIKKCPMCGTILLDEEKVVFHYQQEIDKIESPLSGLYQKRSYEYDGNETLDEKINKKEKEIESLRIEIDSLEQNPIATKASVSDVSYKNILSNLKKQCKVHRVLKNDVSPYSRMIEKENDSYDFISKEINKNKGLLEELKKDIEILKFWDLAFSPQGIQSYLLDKITPIINKFVAKYLMELADGRITATFQTVKKLASGEYKENFSVDISNLDGGNTYISLSGGAKRRVDAAMSLALSDFKRSLTNREVRFICLDESTTGLDVLWTDRFLDMIEKRFSGHSTYFVTHQPIDKTRFKRVITVKKKKGETYL